MSASEEIVAKYRKALEAVDQHDRSFFFGPDGERNRRQSWKGVLKKVRKALQAGDQQQ